MPLPMQGSYSKDKAIHNLIHSTSTPMQQQQQQRWSGAGLFHPLDRHQPFVVSKSVDG
jgi:hypothetical protein